MVRPFRKPLIVASPKMLLRHPSCTSSLSDMAPGTSFQPVLQDVTAKAASVTRVVFVSGKHYYTLLAERDQRKADHIALIRIEVNLLSLSGGRGYMYIPSHLSYMESQDLT